MKLWSRTWDRKMHDNKHIIFHLVFAVLTILIGFYIYKNYKQYSYYSEIDAHGIATEATT